MLRATLIALSIGGSVHAATPMSEPDFITSVARDIAALKEKFPQLADFSAQKHADLKQLQISYGYRTHRAEQRGGWTSGVPNPDRDGVWFYIDLHDADSAAQIHTQPVGSGLCVDGRRVAFLILEGAAVKSLRAEILAVLTRRGAKSCAR